jgi:filamentous hemagglutinin family protein
MKASALAMGGAIPFAAIAPCFANEIALLHVFSGDCTLAQISPDTTLGTQRSVVTPLNPQLDRIEGGATRGVNLFHSFQEFNVGNGRAAYFANPTGIENILSRVTGTNPSNIFGKLGVLGNANLFLINPNGILFGPNAQLDIGGSFFASTASSFKFPDESEFSATKPTAPPLLTVNVTPGLQWGASQPGATITNIGNLTTGQDLTLFADKLDLQGQLQAAKDLTLLAQDSVRVRDSFTTPFLAQAGGNLTIQGNRGIDILALVHPTHIPFMSGGNLSLISDGIISGDARFSSGGSFSIRSVSGKLANMISKHDPIISASGDVDVVANYTGASLSVESKENIRFGGNINITGPDTSTLPAGPDTATLSTRSALIMRSGQSTLAYGGVNSRGVPVSSNGSVPAGITIAGNVIVRPFNGVGGIVTLSAASGNVSTRLISTNGQRTPVNYLPFFTKPNEANGGEISLFAANGSISTGNLLSFSSSKSSRAADGGNISLFAANGSITTGSLYSDSVSKSSSASNGGNISLFALNGSITTGNVRSSSDSILDSASNGGLDSASTGGNITVFAPNGSISTGDLYSYSSSYSGSGNQGGNISLFAANSITIGFLNSSSTSYFGSAANGGNISLFAANGSITTSSLNSHSLSDSGKAGNGGNINISTANGNITTRYLGSSSLSFDGSAANGGNISLFAANGNITTIDLSSSSSSDFGSRVQGGNISLFASNGSITTGNLYSSSFSTFGSAANGGNISLFATNGSITTGDVYSDSSSFAGSGGQGGNITLFATNTLQLLRQAEYDFNIGAFRWVPGGSINSTGALGSGNITIVSNAPLALDNSVISSDTFGSGRGGEIWISAPSISLTGGAQISASTHSSGQGGNITLIASTDIELSGTTSNAPIALFGPLRQAGFAQIPPGTFFGGFVPTGNVPPFDQNGARQFPPGTLFPSGVFAQTTVNSTGSAGTLKIETGRLIVKDGAAIATTIWGQGSNTNDTNIFLEAKDSILVTNGGSILSGVAAGASGNSGNIQLITPSLSVTGGGFVQTQTLAAGNAGNIEVIADAVSLSGAGSSLRSGSGGSNPLLGTTSSNIGQGGDISVTTDSLRVADGAVLDAQTLTNSKGGNITVNANTLSAVNGGQLLTSTSGGGQAGDITISAKEIQLSGSNSGLFAQTSSRANAGNLTLQPLGKGQTLTVNFFDGAQISASTLSSGRGGNLTITAPESITLTGNGSFIAAETSGSGTGGDLTLETGTLTVRDQAKVTVSSTETGNAGNLNVTANLVLLDNGQLIAQTASGEGGNINLKVEDVLLMRNNSLISAQAGNNGNGGNIDINSRLIVAVPSEDSDIVADAERGNGGNINITTSGIFGLEFRQERTPESDITASSKFGIAGTVNINQLAIDPSQGLTNLPTAVADASNQIVQTCSTSREEAGKNKFVITGRGGLPQSPNDLLTPGLVQNDLYILPTGLQSGSETGSDGTSSPGRTTPPTQLVEAQGWEVNDNGQVVLTTKASTVTPNNPLLPSATCPHS